MQMETERFDNPNEPEDAMDVAFRRRLASWAVQLRRIAGGVEGVGGELESLGVPRATNYARVAAERVDDVARYLETADLGQIIDDARSYADDHPAVVAAAAFGIGMATGRIIKVGAGE